jgi:undecaprenyl-diphosphatase
MFLSFIIVRRAILTFQMLSILYVIILAIIQGLAELLPVSSSAHVVVAEKLLGLNPSSPDMTLVLVMLHTGTMFAVIVYFWNKWRTTYFKNGAIFQTFAVQVILATVITGIVGLILQKLIEKFAFRSTDKAEIEQLFSHLELIAPALALAGVLILFAGLSERRRLLPVRDEEGTEMTASQSGLIGAVQGLCLPFRGFSRSGATISTGMLAGVPRNRAESFSFALAVVLTPPVIAREAFRLVKAHRADPTVSLSGAVVPSLLGAVFAFVAGLVALKWLSGWLESGRWYLFGIYCLIASGVVFMLYRAGY